VVDSTTGPVCLARGPLCGEASRFCRRFVDCLEIDLDLHFLTDEDAARAMLAL